MPVGLLGTKIGMTQIYDENGVVIPVTVIQAGPCEVLQVRTQERDGYEAVQIGYGDKKRERSSRSERGHVTNLGGKRERARKAAGEEIAKKDGVEPKRFIKEFRTDGENVTYEFGQELTVAIFEDIARVDVIGTSKGRGFAGVMKRHNFSGQRASHGVKRVHRHGGSIGMSADPARVIKGTRMAGRYGGARITVRYLKVAKIDTEKNLLLVRGAIPGPNGGEVVIRHTTKRKRSGEHS